MFSDKSLGFQGEISDLRIAVTAKESLAADRPRTPDLDLVQMAHDAFRYLLMTPRPHLDYACRFANFLAECPPGRPGEDLVANGDSDCRMDWEYMYLRDMTGRLDSLEVDAGVRRRLLGYVTAEGYALAAGGIYCGGDVDPAHYYISPWTTGKIMYSLAETFARTGDASARTTARKLFLGLKSLATIQGNTAWFAGGCGPYHNGKWYDTFVTYNYGVSTEPVLHYARLTGDKEALAFAAMLARGTVAGMQANLGDRRIREDGSFADHTHLHTHEIWGVADAAATFGDAALLDWVRRVYTFVTRMGGDSGFFPERMDLPDTVCWDGNPERVFASETCITGDMVNIAACLAHAGLSEYYDHIERFIRNYLRRVQFFVTPEVEMFYRARHASRSSAEVEAGLAILRSEYAGGFLGHVGINDWNSCIIPDLAMVGCCVPEGMRALYTAWKESVTSDAEGVTVHLSFTRETPEVSVYSWLPDYGRLTITMKRPGSLRVRVPTWARSAQVLASCNRNALPLIIRDEYLCVTDLLAGDVINFAFDLPAFTQQLAIGGNPVTQRSVSYTWRGNTITGISEPGEAFPLYPLLPHDLQSV